MTWHHDAACRGVPVDAFYRAPGGKLDPAAVDACQRCTVLAECFADVLHHEAGAGLDFRAGYRAGMTAAQRVALTQQRRERLTLRVAEAAWLRTQPVEEQIVA